MIKIIAYYLPQYYPFEENNKWWGEGFTEWTNVGKAKKLFKSHDQPKVPADLGYYDLRMKETREKQVELAIEAGVSGFCYWHYWFGNGKKLLDLPFNEVLISGKPDFPFCLGWANESWKAKVWNSSDSQNDTILIEQKYPGKEDIINHFYDILPALKDKRYIKIENKPLFVIYKPLLLKDAKLHLKIWNELAIENGFSEGIHFVGYTMKESEISDILKLNFNSINLVRLGEHRFNNNVIRKILLPLIKHKFLNKPLVLKYSFISKYFVQDIEKEQYIFPTIIPNWDHTPRSSKRGLVFHNSTPNLFMNHVLKILEIVRRKPKDNQIIFLKSWNEWGEGNYMEPDLKFGKQYIQKLKESLNY